MQILPGELQKGAGTGLGLSISQNLIRIHGGQIGYAVPEDGRGSEFYLEVPMEMAYRQPANPQHPGHSSTPNTSLRLVDGSDSTKQQQGDAGSHTTTGSTSSEYGQDDGAAAASGAAAAELDDDSDEPVIGALPAAEDRQEEDAFIREIADLQLQQHSNRARMSTLAADDHLAPQTALEAPLSTSSSFFSSSSSGSSGSSASGASSVVSAPSPNPLYVSRPALSSPDSSMRVLAQQRMHAQHMRQSAPAAAVAASAALSPAVAQSSRRLLALTRQQYPPHAAASSADGGHTPSSLHGGIGVSGEDSGVSSSGAASVSSRSVSLVMNDAHNYGPAASPLLYKRSPITLTRRVLATSAAPSNGSPLGSSFAASASASALSPPVSADEPHSDGGHGVGGMGLADSTAAFSSSLQLSAGALGLHSSSVQNSTVQPRRGLLHTQQLDGTSPATARSLSSPQLPAVASSPHSLASSNASSNGSGSSSHGSPPTRSDVYITLATYGVATKAQRPTAATSGISSRARDALSALAAAEAAAHATLPHQQHQPRTSSAAASDTSDDEVNGASSSGSSGLMGSTASTTVAPRASSGASLGSLSTASSADGYEPRLTPSSSTSASTSNSAVHNLAAPASSTTASTTTELAAIVTSSSSTSSPLVSQPTSDRSGVAVLVDTRLDSTSGVSGRAEQAAKARQSLAPAAARASPAMSAASSAPVSPLSAAAVPSPAVVPAVVSGPPPPPALRVLVAEDSVPNLKLLLVLLRKCKVDAAGVENGQLAVDKFAAYGAALKVAKANDTPAAALPSPPFDVVLMDGNMPILGGIAATRQLRAMGVTVPIYAVTGNAMAEDTAEFLAAGANEPILTKPVQQKELHRILQLHAGEVRKAWGAKQQQQQLPA